MNNFSLIKDAIEELRAGNMLIVVDDEERENQGDVIFPASSISEEKANFLIQKAKGMFCVPITHQKAIELDIPVMVSKIKNTEKLHCNFAVTVDDKNVKSHGISAYDRFLTVKTLVNKNSKPDDLLRAGHVFPIIAANGGVLERNGHTEAAIDLAKLAGFEPIGVLSEILNDKGEAAKGEELFAFAKQHNLKIISIKDLVDYIKINPLPATEKPKNIIKISEAKLPTKYGQFDIHIYKSLDDNKEHAALIMGDLKQQPILTRVHSECLTGDSLSSLRCDCQEQLHESMKAINENGGGVLIYLNQEGRGIGLGNKIKAYALQDQQFDTVEANLALGFAPDLRVYENAVAILCDLGIKQINLLTNNPDKISKLQKDGITIVKQIPLLTKPNKFNEKYLITKREKMNHQI